MRNEEDFNFISHQSSEDINNFRKLVTECVLATDLAKSMTWLAAAKISLSNTGSKGDSNNISGLSNGSVAPATKRESKRKSNLISDIPVDVAAKKLLLMQLAIKCADVSHPTRNLKLHLEWSNRICEEFFSQGDLERERGVKISPLCDRNIPKSTYPQGQIGFINFVSKPVFLLLSQVCSSVREEDKPWLTYMDSNVQYWEEEKKKNATT